MASLPNNEESEQREIWNKCIRKSTFKIATGVILGAIGSAFLGGNELPLRAMTGLMVGWSYNSCRRLMKPPPPAPPPEDHCACCESNFEALGSEDFAEAAGDPPQAAEANEKVPQEDLRCTCKAGNETLQDNKIGDYPECSSSGCSCETAYSEK